MIIQLTMGRSSTLTGVAQRDVYELPEIELAGVRGLLVGTGCDQVFLRRNRPVLDRFVADGGRIAVCGDVAEPFLVGLPIMTPLDHRGPADLQVVRVAEHPVWRGVDPSHLTYRKGVAGFYGRAFYSDVPRNAVVIHGIGPQARPLDLVYSHGAGKVLAHGGNDLWGYRNDPTSAARISPQLVEWMVAA